KGARTGKEVAGCLTERGAGVVARDVRGPAPHRRSSLRLAMKTMMLPVVAVLLTLSVPAWADDSTPKGDLGKLQGEWEGKAGLKQDTPIRVTFEGNKATLEYTDGNGKKHDLKGEIKLDETAKPHKAIDWSNFSGGDEQSATASR